MKNKRTLNKRRSLTSTCSGPGLFRGRCRTLILIHGGSWKRFFLAKYVFLFLAHLQVCGVNFVACPAALFKARPRLFVDCFWRPKLLGLEISFPCQNENARVKGPRVIQELTLNIT